MHVAEFLVVLELLAKSLKPCGAVGVFESKFVEISAIQQSNVVRLAFDDAVCEFLLRIEQLFGGDTAVAHGSDGGVHFGGKARFSRRVPIVQKLFFVLQDHLFHQHDGACGRKTFFDAIPQNDACQTGKAHDLNIKNALLADLLRDRLFHRERKRIGSDHDVSSRSRFDLR